LQELSRLVLQPLLPHIEKSPQWVISPDGNLWLVPWAALPLPDGSYVVEKYTLRHVVSGRDLVSPPSKGKAESCWVLADPDYDLSPEQGRTVARRLIEEPAADVSLRGLLSQGKLPRFGRLPGTAAEARPSLPG
jgi:hypothetical protein